MGEAAINPLEASGWRGGERVMRLNRHCVQVSSREDTIEVCQRILIRR
jgi:hypothetical protein